MKRILILLITATVMVLVLAPAAGAQVWPSEQPSQDAPAPVPEPETPTPEAKQDDQQTVEIQDFEFSQAELTVEAGTTVTWKNQGNAQHTVTADNGSFDSGRLQPGQSFSHTFQSPGTVPYHCEIHREMTASVTASGGGATTTPDSKGITQPTKVEQETPTKQTSSGGGWLTTALIVGVILVVAATLGWVILRRRAS